MNPMPVRSIDFAGLGMHEMSLAESMIELVEAAAERAQAVVVRRVVLEVGQLASVDVAALQFCFEVVAKGGVARDAMLEIKVVAGQGCCSDCGQTVALPDRLAGCPACGSYRVEPTAGTGLRVCEIEIE